MDVALELCGQHQKDHRDPQQENEEQRPAAGLEVQGFALVIDDDTVGQVLGRQPLQMCERIAEAIARGEIGLDGDGAHPVVAVESRGVGKGLQGHQVGQRDQFTGAGGADVDVLNVGRRALDLALALQDHVVFLARIDEGRDAPRSQHRLQRTPDIAQVDAEIARAVAVDLDAELGVGLLVVVVDVDQPGIVLRKARQQDVPPSCQFLVGAAADGELHRLLNASAQPLSHDRENPHARQAGGQAAHLLHDVPAGAPLGPVLQDQNDDPAVEAFDIAEGTGRADQQARHLTALGQGRQTSLDLVHILGHVVEGGAFRPIDQQEEGTAIFARCELGRDLPLQPSRAAQHQQEEDPDRQRSPQGTRQGASVATLDRRETALHAPRDQRLPAAAGFQQFRGQHGGQGQGNQTGESDRRRHGQRELRKETPDLALQEGQGYEDGDQHQRRRDHREADLPGPPEGSDQRALAALDTPVDVLQHDDGVVDHQPDGQNQRKQG